MQKSFIELCSVKTIQFTNNLKNSKQWHLRVFKHEAQKQYCLFCLQHVPGIVGHREKGNRQRTQGLGLLYLGQLHMFTSPATSTCLWRDRTVVGELPSGYYVITPGWKKFLGRTRTHCSSNNLELPGLCRRRGLAENCKPGIQSLQGKGQSEPRDTSMWTKYSI